MKRLVTEADLRRLARGAKVVVDRDTLVTPAARDYALFAGIDLAEPAAGARRSVASDVVATSGTSKGSCGCGGGCGSSGPIAGVTPPLADGDYLVQVRGGKVTVRRIDG